MTDLSLSRRGLASAFLALALITATALLLIDVETLWQRSLFWVLNTQRELHRTLSDAMRAIAQGHSGALVWMVLLSFLYGVFHAAGPGHGKIVISTYLATHESRLGRGLMLTVLSSLAQGLTAIVAVGATMFLLDWSMHDAQDTALALETGSYGLVALLGLVLCWRSACRLRLPGRQRHGHNHGHDLACGCGHVHGPDALALEESGTSAQLIMTVLSIGIRPCSGAVLVLLLAAAMGQMTAGIASVMAMAIGTALTVSALAVLTVHARRFALGLADIMGRSEATMARLIDGVALIGGLLLMAVGSSLLLASWQIAHHPLL